MSTAPPWFPMALACWSNRPPKRFTSGAACARPPRRSSPRCAIDNVHEKYNLRSTFCLPKAPHCFCRCEFIPTRSAVCANEFAPAGLLTASANMKKLWGWTWRGMAICFALLLLYQLWIFAHICWWVKFNPSASAFMEDRLSVMQDKNPDAELRHKWVPYAKISNNLKRALIASEDAKFIDHEGFDWEGIKKAYEKNLKKGRIVAGGSTISQQLAKNLFLSTKRTPWRKAEEAAITLMLEAVMDKRRILEIYLNF